MRKVRSGFIMIYYKDSNLVIQDMKIDDITIIHNERLSHGWRSDMTVYERYFREQHAKTLYVFIAEYNGDIAGYTILKLQASEGPFADQRLPEVSDFNVFPKYRRKGIGSRILDVVENFAAKFSKTITLAVGLHAGYGSAQRLYVKRGYIPDGSGVWYRGHKLEPYAECCNDDLVLYLYKQLDIK